MPSGQAQKELFVNEGLARIDGLLHCSIEGVLSVPASVPLDGQIWLIASGATGDWAGRATQLACRAEGQWLYIAPREGMRIFDIDQRQELCFLSGEWKKSLPLTEPIGGAVVDTEARAAIASVMAALTTLGICPTA